MQTLRRGVSHMLHRSLGNAWNKWVSEARQMKEDAARVRRAGDLRSCAARAVFGTVEKADAGAHEKDRERETHLPCYRCL